MALNPLHQFHIKELATFNLTGHEITLTNQSLWMIIATLFLIIFFIISMARPKTVPNKMQSIAELSYQFIANLVHSTTGPKGLKFVPLIFSIFFFIAANNVLGLIPGSYTSTSQISITFTMGLCVFALVWVVGLYKHGFKFFKLFIPDGLPLPMVPFMLVLELISFFARPCTLAIRLAANMAAGHILLKVFASFAVMLASVFMAFSIVPAAILLGITALELLVAVLQAYIFTILTCVYINDAINLH
jgi:F-type H+-transporting ATPase subunit a